MSLRAAAWQQYLMLIGDVGLAEALVAMAAAAAAAAAIVVERR